VSSITAVAITLSGRLVAGCGCVSAEQLERSLLTQLIHIHVIRVERIGGRSPLLQDFQSILSTKTLLSQCLSPLSLWTKSYLRKYRHLYHQFIHIHLPLQISSDFIITLISIRIAIITVSWIVCPYYYQLIFTHHGQPIHTPSSLSTNSYALITVTNSYAPITVINSYAPITINSSMHSLQSNPSYPLSPFNSKYPLISVNSFVSSRRFHLLRILLSVWAHSFPLFTVNSFVAFISFVFSYQYDLTHFLSLSLTVNSFVAFISFVLPYQYELTHFLSLSHSLWTPSYPRYYS
jgi:hypothetical protein